MVPSIPTDSASADLFEVWPAGREDRHEEKIAILGKTNMVDVMCVMSTRGLNATLEAGGGTRLRRPR